MLDDSYYKFLKDSFQVLIVDKSCIINDSTDTFFRASKGQDITTVHPFFYILPDLFSKSDLTHYFHCVQMTILAKKKFFDISVRIEADNSHAAIYLHDLTEHYKNVLPIQQNRNESTIQFQTIQKLNEELEEQRMFKDKFLANVSHEIRTPLNSIYGFLNILENSSLGREQLDLVNIIKSSANSLLTIVNDLLDISRIEAGKLDIKNRRFNLKKLFEELCAIYTMKSEDSRFTFTYDFDPKVPKFIVSDRLRIRQILINLLENAIKYTKEGNVNFKIATSSRNARRIPLILEISDTGMGIPEEHQSTIFDSFNQLEKKGLFGGAGLGLSIVKQLTELMGAKIDLHSTVDIGSTFTVTLPVGISHDQKESVEEKRSTRLSKTANKQKKYRILLAEDIEINQLLMVKLFAEYSEYSLDIVKNGERALLMLERYQYDLILMDLTMPLMDGFDAATQIRTHQNKKLRKIPIIAITARTTEEDMDLCKEIGINDVIIKPIDKDILFQKVEKHIARINKKKGKESENS